MSNRAKGNRREQQVADILTADGYKVYRASPAIRFIAPGRYVSGQNDILGAFDLIGKSPAGTLWVQVTTAANAAARRKKAEDAMHGVCAEGDTLQIWAWNHTRAHGFHYDIHTARVEDHSIAGWEVFLRVSARGAVVVSER